MSNGNFIISDEDYDFLQKIYLLEGGENILSLCEEMEYQISPDLIKELIEYCEFKLGEEKKATIRFFVDPKEKKKRFGKAIQKLIETKYGGKYESIAFAFKVKNQIYKHPQNQDGLFERRITIPKYVSILLKRSSMINHTTIEEIKRDCNVVEDFS
jgi:hypothetical protein